MTKVAEAINPGKILDIGFGFWGSRVLLAAVEMEVFTALSNKSMTGEGDEVSARNIPLPVVHTSTLSRKFHHHFISSLPLMACFAVVKPPQ